MIAACDTFRSGAVQLKTHRTRLGMWCAQVMIAACDTFRSGAVEQLKTHCTRLGVPLYERGYEKDPAKVAFEAQRAAERNRKDVLLVDTAGARARLIRLACCFGWWMRPARRPRVSTTERASIPYNQEKCQNPKPPDRETLESVPA